MASNFCFFKKNNYIFFLFKLLCFSMQSFVKEQKVVQKVCAKVFNIHFLTTKYI